MIAYIKSLFARKPKPLLATQEETLAHLEGILAQYPDVAGANDFVVEIDPKFGFALGQLADAAAAPFATMSGNRGIVKRKTQGRFSYGKIYGPQMEIFVGMVKL